MQANVMACEPSHVDCELWFFENMDRINRAIQGTNDLDQMMRDVLEAVLAIFASDRAWLVSPCNPAAASWRVPMECTRPEWPGAFALGGDQPMDAEVASVFEMARSVRAPLRFGPGEDHPVPSELAKRFSVKSVIGVALFPKLGEPYMFGLHQCSDARAWTPTEQRLFQETGRRLEDALTARLMLRDLRESERKLAEAQRISHVAHWERDLVTGIGHWSDEAFRMLGLSPEKRPSTHAEFLARVHPEDRANLFTAMHASRKQGGHYELEYRIIRPNGELRYVHSRADVQWDDAGRPWYAFGTMQDITERKRSEAQLEDLAGRLINTQEEERRRIGRELHDHVSQRLAVLAFMADQLRSDSTLPVPVLSKFDRIYKEADEITADMHALSHRLHSSVIDHDGLVPALEALIAEYSEHHAIHFELTNYALSRRLSSEAALCIFRIAEESLSNVVKHSGASAARVDLRDEGDGILLSVGDDGVGFQPQVLDTKGGLGLVSMRERLRLVHGTLHVHSVPDHGTRVDAWVPAAADNHEARD